MGALSHLKRVGSRIRQAPNDFALFVAQFTPRAHAARATARTLVASLHLDRSPSARFAGTRREY